MNILSLAYENSIRLQGNFETKKVYKGTQILKCKLVTSTRNELSKQRGVVVGYDDIVHIQEKKDDRRPTMKKEKRCITTTLLKSKAKDEGVKPLEST